jgi:predicted nucleic acid-binding protein
MPCLIADSGPLIALAKLDILDLPGRMFGRAGLPATVYAECQTQAGLPDAQTIRVAVEQGWLEVMPDQAWPTDVDVPRLDAGELAALSLARALDATVLMDERRGRESARRLGLSVVGVCGVLLQANRLGWIGPLSSPLAQFKREGYFIPPVLVEQVLVLADER